MAINYRIMGNRLGYGTMVIKDKIRTEQEAIDLCTVLQGAAKTQEKPLSYFVQEYEEARTWTPN